MREKYGFADQNEIEQIHEQILYILKNGGVQFLNDEALEICKKHGAKVDGQTVYIDETLFNKAMSTVPETFEWVGRESSVIVGDHSSVFAPSFGPIFINNNGTYNYPTAEDFINFHKLNETSKVMKAGSANVMDAKFIDEAHRTDFVVGTALKYSTKPLVGVGEGKAETERSIQLIRDFYGITDKRKVVQVALINSASPRFHTGAMLEGLIASAKEGQACICTGGGLPTLTAPDTHAGLFLQCMVESLAGVILTQLVNPGAPAIMGTTPAMVDMRYNLPSSGSPETTFYTRASADMAKFYRIPVRGGGGQVSAKVVDYECGYESFMNMLATIESGIDFVMQSMGILDTVNALSYEKYILDEELYEVIQRYIKGFTVNETTMRVAKMMDVGPGTGKTFLSRTTREYRQENLMTRFTNRDNHQNWMAAGCPSPADMAHEECLKRLREYKLPEMTREQAQILKGCIPAEYENL